MNIKIISCEDIYLSEAIRVWNEVVEEGNAFPQEEYLTEHTGREFFRSQSYCALAIDEYSGKVCGLYILHPNNVGRCSHLCNASFAVQSDMRGRHIGERLVKDCLCQAKRLGFKILQFNAVVEKNIHARHLYERLGFIEVGRIPNGFCMKDGSYETIVLYYCEL